MPVALDLLSPAPATGGSALPSSPVTTASAAAGMSFGRALADARRAPPAPEEARPPEAQPEAARATGSRSAVRARHEPETQDAAATDEQAAAADASATDRTDASAAGEPADAANADDEGCAGDEPLDNVDPRARAAAEVLAELGLIPPPPTPASAAAAVPATVPDSGPQGRAAMVLMQMPAPGAVPAETLPPPPTPASAAAAVPATVPDSGPQGRAAMVLMQTPAPGAVPAETLPAGDAAQTAVDPEAAALPSMQPPPAEAGARLPVELPAEALPAEQDAPPAVQKMVAALLAAAPGGKPRATDAEVPLPTLTDAGIPDDVPPEPLAVPLPAARKPAASDGLTTAQAPVPGHVAQALAAAGQSVQATEAGLAGQPTAPVAAPETVATDAPPVSAASASAAAAVAPAPAAADAGLNPAGVRGATASDAQAVPAPQAPLPLANPRAWAPLLGQHLMHLVQTGDTQATVRVNPPQLGPVELRLELKDTLTHVSFYAHDAQVREALEQSLPRLRELLGAQGLQLGQSHVGDQAQQQQQPRQDGGAMAGFGDQRGSHREQRPADAGATVTAGDMAAVLPVRDLLGGVDQYV